MDGRDAPAPDFFGWERKWVEENQKIKSEKAHRSLEQVVGEVLGE
jgi:hypothetical protein